MVLLSFSQVNCSKELITIQGLKISYNSEAIVYFNLITHSTEKILFWIGTQKNIEGKWKEDAPDIREKDYSKKVLLQELDSNQKLNLSWDIKNTFSIYKSNSGMYRFVVSYRLKKDIKSKMYYYFSTFEIKN